MATYGEDPLARKQWQVYLSHKVAKGMDRDRLLAEMAASNWPREEALSLIRQTASRHRRRALLGMLGCFLLGALGACATLAEYQHAALEGGEFTIWTGAILGGAVGFFWFLIRLLRIRA